MLGENKNLKDSEKDSHLSPALSWQERGQVRLSYGKTNKLITALYMVTDVLEESEPIRHRLRTLGIEIISDISFVASMGAPRYGTRVVLDNKLADLSGNLDKKAHEILSLLEIAFSLRMISEMNHGILKKEFLGLRESIKEAGKDPTILDLLSDEGEDKDATELVRFNGSIGHNSIGHHGTRIGVQKGSTLLKALNNIRETNKAGASPLGKNVITKNDFSFLKDKRRGEIMNILKDMKKNNANFEGASIKDIILTFKRHGEEIGEKTLQRELVVMTAGGLISKTGSKRWSRYSLN